MGIIKKYSTIITWVFIGVIILFSSLNVKWGGDRWHSLIRDDAKGYYAYLPAVFIYQDLSFTFYDTVENVKYKYPKLKYDYRYIFDGKVANKYYVGTAIAEAPFFLLAHFLSKPLGYDSDGYSKIYWISIGYAAIFYMLLGLFFLAKTLELYQLKRSYINIILVLIVFGTHLHYYTSFEPGMTHVFSFGLVSWFIYLSKKYFLHPERKKIFQIAVLIGIISLIRPVNGLIIFLIPFLAGSFESLKSGFQFLVKKHYFSLIGGVLIILGIGAIQLIIYKIQTGSFIVYSYGNEGFNFLDSHMIDILFSYKKGLFLYTPLTFVSLFGGYYMYKENKYELFTLLGFFLLITYVLASWWSWYYGGSFSSRVYVEFLPLFAILLAYLLKGLKIKKWRNALIAFLFILLIHNQKQTYLYRIAYIHFVDMDKEKYWDSVVYPVNWWYYDIRNKIREK